MILFAGATSACSQWALVGPLLPVEAWPGRPVEAWPGRPVV